jgi:raffinose synthase
MQVWTQNKYSGVVGVFHLQGSQWDRTRRRFAQSRSPLTQLSTAVSPWDVASMRGMLADLPGKWAGVFAALQNSNGTLHLVDGEHGTVDVTLEPSDADILTFVPLAVGPRGVRFAPMGLSGMLNAGGAVEGWTQQPDAFVVDIRGEGVVVASSSEAPAHVLLDGRTIGRQGKNWHFEEGKVLVDIPSPRNHDEVSVQHSLTYRFHP